MSEGNIFSRFFRTEEDDDIKPDLDYWKAALEFRQLAYYDRLVDWLTEEALKPVRPEESRDMVISAARQNAFLEVRQHILRDVKLAEQSMKAIDG